MWRNGSTDYHIPTRPRSFPHNMLLTTSVGDLTPKHNSHPFKTKNNLGENNPPSLLKLSQSERNCRIYGIEFRALVFLSASKQVRAPLHPRELPRCISERIECNVRELLSLLGNLWLLMREVLQRGGEKNTREGAREGEEKKGALE